MAAIERADGRSEPALPSDVILSILLCLPAKSLCRFRCVSKWWWSLICSPHFRSHYRGSHPNLILLTTTGKRASQIQTLDKEEWDPSSCPDHRVPSSLDLRCIQTLDMRGRPLRRHVLDRSGRPYLLVPSSLDLLCIHGREIYIRNPTTGEQITLPHSSSWCLPHTHRTCRETTHSWSCRETTHCFDPIPRRGYCHCYRGVSFGRATPTSDYKVVHIFQNMFYSGVPTLRCEVFTLGSNAWREVGSPPYGSNVRDMAVVDGAVHLLPLRSRRPWRLDNDEDEEECKCIARFDLEREEWSLCPLPEGYDFGRHPNRVCLREVGGRLCLECCENMRVELWFQRGDDRKEWVKEHDIDVSALGSSFPRALAMEEEEGGRVLLATHDRLLYYDPKDGRFEEIYAGTNFMAALYVESFTRLNDDD